MNLSNLFKGKTMNQTVINSSNGQSIIQINGTTYNVQGNNISVRNGSIYVDNNLVVEGLSGIVEIKFEGNLANLESTSSVSVNGNVEGNINAGDSITISGNVSGNVNSGDSVKCGDVKGSVKSGDSIHCGNIGGSATAGDSIYRL